jgi:WD40 repeat protein
MNSFSNLLPEDTVYLLHLPYHLAHASMDDELCTILTDYNFINHKITISSPQLLIEDYGLTQSSNSQIPEKEKESLKLIQAAISLSENILDEDKTQLAGQLLGRLLLFEMPEIQTTLLQAKQDQQKEPWLRPLTSSLTPPGEPLLRTLTGHNNWVTTVAITPDGDKFVSASEDATIKIWNLNSGSLINTLTGHNKSINSVAIAPDGKTIISASDDKTLKIWNLETGEELLRNEN